MARRRMIFATLPILCFAVSASAETLRCQSVNGNLNCAGSSGVSCQTVDGRKVCVSGNGGVVQSFGSSKSSHDDAGTDDAGIDGDSAGDDTIHAPALQQRLEQHDSSGRTLRLQRDGSKLHLQTNWLTLDRE